MGLKQDIILQAGTLAEILGEESIVLLVLGNESSLYFDGAQQPDFDEGEFPEVALFDRNGSRAMPRADLGDLRDDPEVVGLVEALRKNLVDLGTESEHPALLIAEDSRDCVAITEDGYQDSDITREALLSAHEDTCLVSTSD